MPKNNVVILGAGPAGMACAYNLAEANQPSLVIEKYDIPGGMCRTINYYGYFFDVGGHRFLSKSEEINKLWQKVMNKDMLKVKRVSRIYYRKRYFNYPLTFFNTFWNLGLIESFLCIASYLRYKIKSSDDTTFEGWITNRFGKRLFEIFFKTYTEKIWGVATKNISADWAAERIRGLSLKIAIQKALLGARKGIPKTLSDEFLYPRTGSGEFYQRLYELTLKRGGQFVFNKNVIRIKHNSQRVLAVEIQDCHNYKKEELVTDYLFSSIPLPVFIKILDPPPPENILVCAKKLQFRSHIAANIILDKEHVFPDQWIYIHSPNVKLGRIQNYKNWSSVMVKDTKKTSLGLEYFCTEGDYLWNMNDIDLINFALQELEKVGIASRHYLIDGFVVRQPNAYPVYYLGFRQHLNVIQNYIEKISNLQIVGRGGLFRYGNSDYALLTGIYSARNFLGENNYNIWEMDAERTYLES